MTPPIVSQQLEEPTAIDETTNPDGFSRLVIVDDAFDALTIDRYGNELADFVAQVEPDEPALAELETIGFSLDDLHNLDDSLLQRLDSRQSDFLVTRDAFERTLGLRINEVRHAAYLLKANLESLGFAVTSLGTDANADDIDAQVAFIDYFLADGTPNKGIELIHSMRVRPNSTMPLVILMSSKPAEISEEDKDLFREKCGLIGGMFYFLRKADISDPAMLALYLRSFSSVLGSCGAMQEYADAIEATLRSAGKQFMRSVRKLGLADYAYIQRLALYEDGHPLGHYMEWLYSAHLGYLLFEGTGLTEIRRKLDRIRFSQLPPAQHPPSDQLADMCISTMYNVNIDAVGTYPVNDPENPETELPYVHLGDLYVSSTFDHVWMVISAQCDLSYSLSTNRPFDPSMSVLFLKGDLEDFRSEIGHLRRNKPRTQPFRCGEKLHRIEWNTKQVMSIDYGEVNNWQEANKYNRQARLRLPYALEVQRAFAGDLTRVGLPVIPPMPEGLYISVRSRNPGGTFREILPPTEDAAMKVLFRKPGDTRESVHLVYTLTGIRAIRSVIPQAIEDLAELVRTLENGQQTRESTRKANRATEAIEALKRASENNEAWASLLTPCMPPAPGKELLLLTNSPIGIIFGNPDHNKNDYENKMLVFLHTSSIDDATDHVVN